MQEILGNDETVIFRRFENIHDKKIRGCVIFTELLVNNIVIDQNVVKPLLTFIPRDFSLGENLSGELAKRVVSTDEVKTKDKPYDAISAMLIGDTVVLIDSCRECIVANSKKYSIRSIGVPETEDAVFGPKEGFTELIVANASLLRRHNRFLRIRGKMGWLEYKLRLFLP